MSHKSCKKDEKKNDHCKSRKRKWGRRHHGCHKPPVPVCHKRERDNDRGRDRD